MNSTLKPSSITGLIVLAFALSSASLFAQTKKKPFDWINVQVGGGKASIQINTQAATDSISKQSGNAGSPAASPAVPAPQAPGGVEVISAQLSATSSATGPQTPQALGSVAKSTSSAPVANELSPDNAPNAGQVSATTSAGGGPTPDPTSAPRISISPLKDILSSYDSLKDTVSRDSFVVSRDGQHCAYVQRAGLAGYVVLIDGQSGPQFTSRIGTLTPNEDFSQIFYQTEDATRRIILVIQKRNGTAKTFLEKSYTIETAGGGHNPNDYWNVFIKDSLRYRRLIRQHIIVSAKTTTSEWQVDEDGPVLGPFDAYADVILEDDCSHYLVRGLKPAGKGLAEPLVFLDGVRVGKDALPGQVSSKAAFHGARLLGKSGGYWVRLSAPGLDIDIVNGKKVSWVPPQSEKLIPSEDGKHLAYTKDTPAGRGIFLDGALVGSQPAQVQIRELQVTGDGQGLVYLMQIHNGSVVVVDNRATEITGAIEGLTAGPHKGQFMCFVRSSPSGSWQFVINERRLELGGSGHFGSSHRPDKVWFSAEGQHAYGYQRSGNSFVAFSDNLVSNPEANVILSGLLKPTIVGQDKWEIVAAGEVSGPGQNKGIFRIEVELPQGKLPKQ